MNDEIPDGEMRPVDTSRIPRTGWQPIATAPKDRRFLGFRPPQPHEFDWYGISVCKYRESADGGMRLYSEADYEGLPFGNWTHWMPLPEIPE